MIPVFIFIICAIVAIVFGVIGILCFLNSRYIGILTQKKKGLESSISGLQAQLCDTTKAEAEARGETAKLNSEIAIKRGELEGLKTEINRAKDDPNLVNYNQEKDKIKKRISELVKECGEKEADRQKKNKELEEVTRKLGETNQKLNDAKNQLGVVESVCATKEEESKRLDEHVKNLRAEKEKLDRDLVKLGKDIVDAKDKLEKLKKTSTDSEALNATLEKQIDEKKKALKELEDAYEEEHKKIEELNKEVRTLEGRKCFAETFLHEKANHANHVWDELEKPVQHQFSHGNDSVEPDELKWLETFNENLKSVGYKFEERCIKAFHTSLKCADISPLTVLSGVSGTGKSLLPQLYANASGMHFTILPVQPRWDNPSDLFGFYNHLEGQFKATGLSRIFYEMGIHHKKEGDEKMFPMHLVLLDEMNLARVEYYFSEFLSKLETRRVDRSKAKIPLECAGAGVEAKEIYPWENVLFVGTMNEDETTQTLSDKVIDRANVLRFGVPKKFGEGVIPDRKTPADAFKEKYADIKARTKRDWDNWNRLKTGECLKERNFLLTKLEKINEAIQSMDRAFAHRVVQAVESYVANYPGVDGGINIGNTACRNAVSDAIEMKIFPKMNGLDKTDPAFKVVHDTISEQIKDLDDELKEAFERDSKEDSSSPFFKWKGTQK